MTTRTSIIDARQFGLFSTGIDAKLRGVFLCINTEPIDRPFPIHNLRPIASARGTCVQQRGTSCEDLDRKGCQVAKKHAGTPGKVECILALKS